MLAANSSEGQASCKRFLNRARNGRAAAEAHDAGSCRHMIDPIDFAQAVEGIQQGLDSLQRGDGQPVAHAMESIRKKHRISRSG